MTGRFDVADERAHAPGTTAEWCEAWQLDLASDAGVGVAVRLAFVPASHVAWWWTHLLLPDLPGPVVVRDHEVALPRQGLEIRADGLWAELVCETPFEHWTYGLEAFGVRLDDPADSMRGEIGERLPVGFDLEWEVDPTVGAVRERAGGYEQFGTVRGEVLLGRSRIDIDAAGRRAHAWGELAPEVAHTWVRTPDAAVSVDDIDTAGIVHTEELGSFVVPFGERATLRRALCRFTVTGADGGTAHGNGWSTRVDSD